MKVYVFDLMAYGRQFDEFRAKRYIPYPLPRRHFDPEIAARTFEEHLEAWEEMDRLGYDGVGLNEHHTTVHGLMNSPNMMAAAAAQRTKRLKLLVLGHLLPMHNPLRLAEEIAMADVMSRGRVLAGIARGAPREYGVFNVPPPESRARFEEAHTIIMKAWTEEVFSHEGRFWSFKDIAIWPRPYQQPHPPVWIPFTGSQETIEWAGKHNLTAVITDATPGLTEDIVGHFARSLAHAGHRITPDHLCVVADAFVADGKAAAIAEYAPSYLYFTQTLWHHGTITEAGKNVELGAGYAATSSHDYVRPENRTVGGLDRSKIRMMEIGDVEARVESGKLHFGSPKEVTDRLIALAERVGAESVLINMNNGAMPHAQYMDQLRRFGREVLPALQAHRITRVPVAEHSAA
ncbi:MAG TPA: LLM class flavin-dependent oxidoreductase [Stellaceae bacterium]|nr:LLM class flavin-dependent oxidoreductase [Stellaceae bacterium]